MPRAVMEGFRPRRPFGGFRRRGRCPVGTPMPSGSGGGAVRVHSTTDGKDTPSSSRRMPAPGCLFLRFQPRCSVGSRERGPLTMSDEDLPRLKAGRVLGRPVEMSAFNAKAMVWPRNADFGQIRHGVEWRPAMFRVASVSVKCGRGGGPDLASIGDDDIPYIYLNN